MRAFYLVVTRYIVRLRPLDRAALFVICTYLALAFGTQSGASVAGQGLDPVLAAARQRGTLRVAVDFGFLPFSGIVDNQPIGYDIELAREVATRLGLQVEFVPSGLDSIYDDLAARRADMAASALPYAPEQGWRARFSSFYFNAGQVLVVPQGSPINQIDQLDGRAVGVPLGSDADTYARRLLADGFSFKLIADRDTPAEVIAALRRAELDAVIIDHAAALTELAAAPELQIATALTLEPYVLAVAPDAFQLHAEINRVLDTLRREGFFDELGRRWFR
ncbi:MAG TPA: ABC transporter substrate-binding protein [Roseiflexaceae bacterium]|nr:ABC transporter substrate-binding protein [Roseiflexaceae bacterium]